VCLGLEDTGAGGQQTGGDDNTEGLRRLVLVPRRRSDKLQVASPRERTAAVGTHRDRDFLSHR